MLRAVTKTVYEARVKAGTGTYLTLEKGDTVAYEPGQLVHANDAAASKLAKLGALGTEPVLEVITTDEVRFGNRKRVDTETTHEDGSKTVAVTYEDVVHPKGTRLKVADLGGDAIDVLKVLAEAPPAKKASPAKKEPSEG